MSLEPDTKDWTWVLRERCPECGLTAAEIAPEQIGDLVRASLPRWTAVLQRPDARERRSPVRWSDLEYGCHVRDVFRVFDDRLALVLATDGATFANWDQDATALEQDYAAQDPAAVADELVAAGTVVADRFDTVTAADHARRGLRSNGSEFTTVTLGQYFWHDVHHHLHDVAA